MNAVKERLSRLPQSDTTWHCPWFRVIEGLSLWGAGWGTVAGIAYHSSIGWAAVGLGATVGSFCFGNRTRGDHQC